MSDLFLILLIVFHVIWTEVIHPGLEYARDNIEVVLFVAFSMAGIMDSVNQLLCKVREWAAV